MTVTGTKEQGGIHRLSKMAVCSTGLVLFGGLMTVIHYIIPNLVSFFSVPLCIILSLGFGAYSTFAICRSKGQLKGLRLAVAGIAISIVLGSFVIYKVIRWESVSPYVIDAVWIDPNKVKE